MDFESTGHKIAIFACFWIASCGVFFVWISFPSTVFHWIPLYGPRIILFFTTAYCAPAIFIQLLQATFDRKINEHYGKFLAFLVRLSIPMALLIGIAASVPFLPDQLPLILAFVVVCGMCSSVAYGTLFQLVTIYPRTATSMLSLGYSSPGVLVPLLGMLMFGLPSNRVDSFNRFMAYWLTVAGIALCGLISFLILMWNSKPHLDEQTVQDSARATIEPSVQTEFPRTNPSEDESLLHNGLNETDLLFHEDPNQDEIVDETLYPTGTFLSEVQDILADAPISSIQQFGNIRILGLIWPTCIAILISNVSRLTTMNVLSHVPQQNGETSPNFSQVLIFISLGCDLAGRFLTLPFMPQLPKKQAPLFLLCLSIFQLISCSFIQIQIFQPHARPFLPRNDLSVQIFLGVFATITGYLQTACYIVAPKAVPLRFKTQVGALMNIFIQSGNIVALAIGYALEFFAF